MVLLEDRQVEVGFLGTWTYSTYLRACVLVLYEYVIAICLSVACRVQTGSKGKVSNKNVNQSDHGKSLTLSV